MTVTGRRDMPATGAVSSQIRRSTAVITPRPFVCEVEALATLDRSLASEVPAHPWMRPAKPMLTWARPMPRPQRPGPGSSAVSRRSHSTAPASMRALEVGMTGGPPEMGPFADTLVPTSLPDASGRARPAVTLVTEHDGSCSAPHCSVRLLHLCVQARPVIFALKIFLRGGARTLAGSCS